MWWPWQKKATVTDSQQRRLLDEPENDLEATPFEIRRRSSSALTDPTPIPTKLGHASAPFERISETNSVSPDTLAALRHGCTFSALVKEHPDDVLTVLKEMSVARLGSITATKDSQVLQAFGSRRMLTRGSDQAFDRDWEKNWTEIIEERCRSSGIQARFSVGWEQKVKLGAYVVNLKNVAQRNSGDLLELLLEKSSAGAASMNVWEFPAVKAVVNYVWDHWARKVLLIMFSFFVLWTLCFGCYLFIYIESWGVDHESNAHHSNCLGASTVVNRAPPLDADMEGSEDTVSESHEEKSQRMFGSFSDDPFLASLTNIFNILCFALMCPFGVEEYWTIFSQGRQWIQLQNILDIGAISLQAFIFTCHVTDLGLLSSWFGIVLAAQTCFLSLRLLYFVRILGGGTAFFDSAWRVIYETRYWFAYIIFSGISASFCLAAMYKPDTKFREAHKDFITVGKSLVTTFQIIFGSFNTHYIFDARYSVPAFLFFFAFQILMTITVLNLIIAAMSEAYTSLASQKVSQHYRVRATVIEEIDTLKLPKFLTMEPAAYVHFLVVENQQQESLASSQRAGSQSPRKSDDEVHRRMDELSAKLDAVLTTLDLLAQTRGYRGNDQS